MLTPVAGSHVLHVRTGQYGVVTGHSGNNLNVTWADGQSVRVARQDVRCGLQVGQVVMDRPSSLRLSLGEGRVLQLRVMGGVEQLSLIHI